MANWNITSAINWRLTVKKPLPAMAISRLLICDISSCFAKRSFWLSPPQNDSFSMLLTNASFCRIVIETIVTRCSKQYLHEAWMSHIPAPWSSSMRWLKASSAPWQWGNCIWDLPSELNCTWIVSRSGYGLLKIHVNTLRPSEDKNFLHHVMWSLVVQ